MRTIDRLGLDLLGWRNRTIFGFEASNRGLLWAKLWRDGPHEDDEVPHFQLQIELPGCASRADLVTALKGPLSCITRYPEDYIADSVRRAVDGVLT